MRSLILGASGLIGSNLATACAARGHRVTGTCYRRAVPDLLPLDVRDGEAIAELIAEHEPEVTFFAVGTAHPADVGEVVAAGVATVAKQVRSYGGTFVYISSANVFGHGAGARSEADSPQPSDAIGRAAVAAEVVLREELPGRHLILRTSEVYGPAPRPRGLPARVLRTLARGEAYQAGDGVTQPTYAPDLAAAALDLVERGYTGTMHVAGPDKLSEYTFARLVTFVHREDCDRVERAPGEPSRPALDRNRARAILGAKAIRYPADGLRAARDIAAVRRLHAA